VSKDEVVKVALSKKEIAILLDVLHFAQRAATILAHEEVNKGGGLPAAKKMTLISDNCAILYKIFYNNFDIGEPPIDTMM